MKMNSEQYFLFVKIKIKVFRGKKVVGYKKDCQMRKNILYFGWENVWKFFFDNVNNQS